VKSERRPNPAASRERKISWSSYAPAASVMWEAHRRLAMIAIPTKPSPSKPRVPGSGVPDRCVLPVVRVHDPLRELRGCGFEQLRSGSAYRVAVKQLSGERPAQLEEQSLSRLAEQCPADGANERAAEDCPLGCPPLPIPTTLKNEPTLEKVPPVWMVPLSKAPVANETEPRECPGAIPLNWLSFEPFEVIPALEIEIVPKLLDRSTVFAQTAIGRSATLTPRTVPCALLPSIGVTRSARWIVSGPMAVAWTSNRKCM